MLSTLKAHPYWPTSSSKALPSRDSTTFPVTSWDQVFKHIHLWGKFWIQNTVHVRERVEFNWVKKEKKCICMLYTNIKHTCTYVYTSTLDLAWGRGQRTRDRLRGWRGSRQERSRCSRLTQQREDMLWAVQRGKPRLIDLYPCCRSWGETACRRVLRICCDGLTGSYKDE